MYVLFNTELEM